MMADIDYDKLRKIVKKEAETAFIIARIEYNIEEALKETKLDGVSSLGNGCQSVSLSTIANNELILSPEYYSPETQAKLVGEYLSSAETGTALMSRIQDLTQKGYIKKGNNHERLNPKTISVLKRFIKEE